jgi:hypothetical protein
MVFNFVRGSVASGYLRVGGLQVGASSMMQGAAIPMTLERAGRLASATRMENDMPNKVIRRQTIVKRRASIGVSFNACRMRQPR